MPMGSNPGRRSRVFSTLLAIGISTAPAGAMEFFVAENGSDSAAGTSPDAPLKDISRAVNRLQPGDILTLAPGHYMQPFVVRRQATAARPITIRAAIPGFTVIHGDRECRGFKPVEGTRFIWAVPCKQPVYRVVERDTGVFYLQAPSLADMDQYRQSFIHDLKAGTLYVHTSDGRSPDLHALAMCVVPAPGIAVLGSHIHVEGLVVRGFVPPRVSDAPGGFGMVLADGSNEVRNCTFIHNGGGVTIDAEDAVVADNLFIGNVSPLSSFAQIHCTGASKRVRITGNRVLGPQVYGIRNYATPTDSVVSGNIVKGAYLGLDFKASEGDRREATRNVVVDCSYLNWHSGNKLAGLTEDFNVFQTPSSWYQKEEKGRGPHTLLFDPARDDPKFADPEHLDYRLQADSPFRGKGPGGADLGAFPCEPTVFYVAPTGNDDRDGLSVSGAFRTVERAAKTLKPGATLYLLPGQYDAAIRLDISGEPDRPIAIRGRGKGEPIRVRGLALTDVRHVRIENLRVDGPVHLRNCQSVTLDRCFVSDPPAAGVSLDEASDVWLRRLTVWNAGGPGVTAAGACDGLRITSSILHSRNGPALALAALGRGGFTEYNDYLPGANQPLAVVGDRSCANLDALRQATGFDRRSISAGPRMIPASLVAAVSSDSPCVGAGESGEPIGAGDVGPETPEQTITDIKLRDVTPTSASLTWWTPNLTAGMYRTATEWWLNHPVYAEVRFGKTPACERRIWSFGHLYHNVSFHDLDPDTTYHFKIVLHDRPWDDSLYADYGPVAGATRWSGAESEPLAFKTPGVADWQPTNRTFYVAPNGSAEDSGLQQEAPTTLTAAGDRVRAGDTIIMLDGVYREMFCPAATGVPNAPIAIKARMPGRVVLDGADGARPTGVALFRKRHVIVDGLIMVRFADRVLGRRAGLINSEVFCCYCEDITLTNSVLVGWNPMSSELACVARAGGPLTFSNCVFTGFMHGVVTRKTSQVNFFGNTWYVPLIDCFQVLGGKAVLKNNLFFGQEQQKVFQYAPMVSKAPPAESDYNAYYFGPGNTVRYIGFGLKRAGDEPDMGGLERWQRESGFDRHSLEPARDDVRLSGPAPTDYLDGKAMAVFRAGVRKGTIVPALEMFAPPPGSRLNTAGENGRPIGARKVTFGREAPGYVK